MCIVVETLSTGLRIVMYLVRYSHCLLLAKADTVKVKNETLGTRMFGQRLISGSQLTS